MACASCGSGPLTRPGPASPTNTWSERSRSRSPRRRSPGADEAIVETGNPDARARLHGRPRLRSRLRAGGGGRRARRVQRVQRKRGQRPRAGGARRGVGADSGAARGAARRACESTTCRRSGGPPRLLASQTGWEPAIPLAQTRRGRHGRLAARARRRAVRATPAATASWWRPSVPTETVPRDP